MKNKVGNNIRKLRQAKGMSQENVADEIGMGASSYSKIERGETEPNISRLSAIARTLGVTIADLVSDETPVNDPKKSYGNFDFDSLNQTLQMLVAEIQSLRSDLTDKNKKESSSKLKPKARKK